MTTIACPHCGRDYDASHRIAGDTVLCPGCNEWFTVRFRAGQRQQGACDECGTHAPLNAIYASHSADVCTWLCDTCRDKRQAALEAMYRGD